MHTPPFLQLGAWLVIIMASIAYACLLDGTYWITNTSLPGLRTETLDSLRRVPAYPFVRFRSNTQHSREAANWLRHHLTEQEADYLVAAATGTRKVVAYEYLLRYHPQRQYELLLKAARTPGLVYYRRSRVSLVSYLSEQFSPPITNVPPLPPETTIESCLTQQQVVHLQKIIADPF